MIESVVPAKVVQSLIALGESKTRLTPMELLVRSALAGAFLGVATTLAFTAAGQTGLPIVGALIFPVGFAMIVVLGLDLVTGSFALLPMAVMAGRATVGQMIANWTLTFIGNFIGSLIFAGLMYLSLTSFGHDGGGPVFTPVVEGIKKAVTARSAGFANLGAIGLGVAFVRAMLCNWMVCLGVVMGVAAATSAGKIIGAWLPIVIFFAQGFEHCVVNMSLFPLGLMLGANATVRQYLLFNELPVTIGNLVGGFLFTGLGLYLAYPAGASGRGQELPAGAQPAE